MPDMGYDSAGLRTGATGHGESARAADAAARALSTIQVVAAAFGTVPAVPGFCGGVENARWTQGRGAGAEAAERSGLAERVRRAAALGAGLTTSTTTIASEVDSAIARRMR